MSETTSNDTADTEAVTTETVTAATATADGRRVFSYPFSGFTGNGGRFDLTVTTYAPVTAGHLRSVAHQISAQAAMYDMRDYEPPPALPALRKLPPASNKAGWRLLVAVAALGVLIGRVRL